MEEWKKQNPEPHPKNDYLTPVSILYKELDEWQKSWYNELKKHLLDYPEFNRIYLMNFDYHEEITVFEVKEE